MEAKITSVISLFPREVATIDPNEPGTRLSWVRPPGLGEPEVCCLLPWLEVLLGDPLVQWLMTFPGVWSCPQLDPHGLVSPGLCRELTSPFLRLEVWRRAAPQGSHSSGAHPQAAQVGQDVGSGCLKDMSCSKLSLAPLQGGSSEPRRCLRQLGECLAGSDIQELGNGPEVSRNPCSGR